MGAPWGPHGGPWGPLGPYGALGPMGPWALEAAIAADPLREAPSGPHGTRFDFAEKLARILPA